MNYQAGFFAAIMAAVLLSTALAFTIGLSNGYSDTLEDFYKTIQEQRKRADSLQNILNTADGVAIVHDLEVPTQLKDYVFIPANVIKSFHVGDTISAYEHSIFNESADSRFYVITEIKTY